MCKKKCEDALKEKGQCKCFLKREAKIAKRQALKLEVVDLNQPKKKKKKKKK